jgi:hypothetical protein
VQRRIVILTIASRLAVYAAAIGVVIVAADTGRRSAERAPVAAPVAAEPATHPPAHLVRREAAPNPDPHARSFPWTWVLLPFMAGGAVLEILHGVSRWR